MSSSSSAPVSPPPATSTSSPSPPPTTLALTRTQKLQAFVLLGSQPTSGPFLFGILLDLFCSLLYAVCVTVNLLYAPEDPKWVPGLYALCALVYGAGARRKWMLRRDAFQERRRRETEGNEAERMWIREGEEHEEKVDEKEEKREMVEV
ncbi:hypothetical protein BDY24DRAFT_392368 [Mrakia frigida]|uniref:uncharacterized protein n=1 Tax=Mrakia frigida TaxID=29902 RepID=UPI003FCC0F80